MQVHLIKYAHFSDELECEKAKTLFNNTRRDFKPLAYLVLTCWPNLEQRVSKYIMTGMRDLI